ncbi:MAG TPA: glycosyltransferase family 2 protein [Edaphobacter sp.]|nr:glycosyltransferase family 2 protein [Edaphobacter sp.]
MMNLKTLSVVIPAFNEGRTLAAILERVLVIPHLFEIVIVDDGSSDDTLKIAYCLAECHPELIRVVPHDRNQGKTAALRSGFVATRGDIVIVQDADLEYDPAEIAGVIQPIMDGVADVVYGSRFLIRKADRASDRRHLLANKVLTFVSNLFTSAKLTDVETGYKAFRGDIIRNMIISSSGFGFEVEVTAKIAKLHCTVHEVPISYCGRTYQQGKKIRFADGIVTLWYIFFYNVLCNEKNSFRNLLLIKDLVDARTSCERVDRFPIR